MGAGGRAFSLGEPQLWDTLEEIKMNPTLAMFKFKCKSYLCDKALFSTGAPDL